MHSGDGRKAQTIPHASVYTGSQKEVEDVLLVEISLSTISKFIYQSGFTRQRLWNVALQQDAFQREQYKSDVSVYAPEMFVFVRVRTDATHCENMATVFVEDQH